MGKLQERAAAAEPHPVQAPAAEPPAGLPEQERAGELKLAEPPLPEQEREREPQASPRSHRRGTSLSSFLTATWQVLRTLPT